MPARALSPAEQLLMLRRRKWWFLLPAAAVLAATVAVTLAWPPTYRSTATILIEEAEMPEDLQGLVVAEYVEKRFEAITRRVMVTDSLLGIVERYRLYPERRKREPLSKLAAAMREDIHTEMIRANVVDPKSGQRRSLTVAFSLAFDYPEPATAQKVANELVSLYLDENIRQRRERAAETAGFVRSSLQEAEQKIRAVEQEIAAFKARNAGLLPEDQLAVQSGMARLESEQRDLDRQLAVLRQREAQLAALLARTEPVLLYGENGQPQSPAARLETMRAELVRLSARYSADHPDVVRLKREIEALAGETPGTGGGTGALRREREQLRTEIAALDRRYGPDHPDVAGKRRELARIEEALRAAGRSRTAPVAGGRPDDPAPDNPAYVSLQAELASVRAELAALSRQAAEVARSLAELRERALRAPQVEREHQLLQRRLQDALAVREGLTKMEASVQLGQSLDSQLKAEQLSLIEPPSLPERPEKPNRPLLLLIGCVLALGAGTAGVVTGQLLDDAVWSPEDMAALLGEMPLAIVPHASVPAGWRLARLRAILPSRPRRRGRVADGEGARP
ncbi:Wzz/FepE/Etk N-terminal domain-containing protein [Benzoatithermus flavus]|jgi:uncharacterized protein involved in exopolysaccharide biosynthesis|uniref:Wzz/FepE/Etk N-terminal domain-containing protein n=2 Tax=Pseudomonadota TaxID=1224 RepID=A0ABU8Y0A8_9PROT